MVAGPHAIGGDPLQVTAQLGRDLLGLLGVRGTDLLRSEQAGLDALGQVDFLLGVEQRDLADVGQVDPDEVGGRDLLVPGAVVDEVVLDDQVGRWGSARGIGADGDAALVDEADDALGLGRTNAGLVEGLTDLGESDSTLLAGLLEEVLDRRGQAGVTGSAGNRGSAHEGSSPPGL